MTRSRRAGAVVIGRNEGDRLKRCIQSLQHQVDLLVYVDSGSTDGSAEWVREQGIPVVSLDLAIPFTAARARNEGFDYLMQETEMMEYVFFVDGDCEVCPDWLEQAMAFLDENSQVGVVCGRRRERYPEVSIYNRLCDDEWNTPIGEACACGGDSVMRVAAFRQVSGFRPDVIAGEEPELCFRLREKDWKVWRIDHDMTFHDAALVRFSQWWKRMERGGYAYFLGALMHGKTAENYRVRESVRILFWGGGLPVFILLASFFSSFAWFSLLAYPVLWTKIFLSSSAQRTDWRALSSAFMVMAKFPECLGGLRCLLDKLTQKKAQIIEYK